jgi:hydrogenase maturation factor
LAYFIGREQLISSISSSRELVKNDLKGLEGELQVGDVLANWLPEDTYVITHPSIGKYDPDFLVISPKYGFRIVEVKNWNGASINEIYPNGAMRINTSNQNPLIQVKKHIDEFNGYIRSLNIPTLKDAYKMTGYVVIHCGFARKQIEEKLQGWNYTNKKDFFKHHIFLDQFGYGMDLLLENATKYPFRPEQVLLSEAEIKSIILSITIENELSSDAVEEINTKLIEYDKKIEQLEMNIKVIQIKEEIAEYKINPVVKQKKSKMIKKYGLVILSTIITISIYSFFQPAFFKVDGNSQNANDVTINDLGVGESVEIEAEVKKFNFDKVSGVKFLLLSDGNQEFDGVIFKGVSVPYLYEGETYKFKGKIDTYNDKTELVIEQVE